MIKRKNYQRDDKERSNNKIKKIKTFQGKTVWTM